MNKEKAIELIRESDMAEHTAVIVEHLMPSARLVVHDGPEPHTGHSVTSHFGGVPFLPRDTTWPLWDRREFLSAEIARLEAKYQANPRATGLRDIAARMRQDLACGPVPLSFLGQLSLREMNAAAPLTGWPSDGTLAFFFDSSQGTWGFDPLARGHCRVLFFHSDEELTPAVAPRELAGEAVFPMRRLGFRREWTLPTRIEFGDGDHSIWGNDEYRLLCQRLMPGMIEEEPIHRCGGHPQEVQGEMRLECQLVTNGIYCGDSSGYQDPRRPILEKSAADWHLLLQIDSDEERLGWMWGDAGRIYFWARHQDIEAADFDGAWAILQCY